MGIYAEYQPEWFQKAEENKQLKIQDLRESWIELKMEESAADGSNAYGSMGGSIGKSTVGRRTNAQASANANN